MIASFYYILIQNPEWNKFIYIYLVSLQKKKTTQVNAKYEGKKTRKKTIIKQLKTKTRKPYGFMQNSFWVIMMVHVMVCGDL